MISISGEKKMHWKARREIFNITRLFFHETRVDTLSSQNWTLGLERLRRVGRLGIGSVLLEKAQTQRCLFSVSRELTPVFSSQQGFLCFS